MKTITHDSVLYEVSSFLLLGGWGVVTEEYLYGPSAIYKYEAGTFEQRQTNTS